MMINSVLYNKTQTQSVDLPLPISKIAELIIPSNQMISRYLFLGGKIWVNSKMYLVHEALNHGDGVGAAGLRVDGLLHDDGGDITELARKLRLPLLAGDLELPFLQNLKQQQDVVTGREPGGLHWIVEGIRKVPRCRFGSGHRCRRP